MKLANLNTVKPLDLKTIKLGIWRISDRRQP
jgi:hypothetical protein